MVEETSQEIIPEVKKRKRFGKKGFTTQLLSTPFYQGFKDKHPEYANLSDRTLETSARKIFDGIVSIIIEEPDGVMLGNNMGEMKLGLLRIHNVIDRLTSKEVGKPVKYLNYHTDRKPGKLVWKTEYSRKVHYYLRYLGFRSTKAIGNRCFNAFKDHGKIFKDITDKHTHIK